MHRKTQWAIFCLFALTFGHAHAFLREISPGTQVKLAPDEGLLLVSVDTLMPLKYVRVQREGNIFSSAKLPDLKAGVTTQLYAARQGKYRWDKVELLDNMYFDLADDAELKFEIKPGVINYPGDLLFREVSMRQARMRAVNRALHALDWLETGFPALYQQTPFQYVGRYPDPFPEFYRKARERHPDRVLSDLDKTVEVKAADTLPLPIEELWQPGRIASVALNPGGNLLAEAVYEKGKWGIDLIDLQAGEAKRLVNPPFAVSAMHWFDDKTLVTSLGLRGEMNLIAIFHVAADGSKGHVVTNINLPYMAKVLGVSSDPPSLVVASQNTFGQMIVHRVDITNQTSINHSKRTYDSRLNKGLDDDFAWYTDRAGQVRAALAKVGREVAMFYGAGSDYRELMRFNAEDEAAFYPFRLSADGSLIYGFTDQGRSQRDFAIYDPSARAVTRTLFSKPGVDAIGALFNSAGAPIGATYFDSGHVVSAYFDDADQHLNKMIEKAFPDRTAVMMARDEAGKIGIIGVDGSDYPFAIYQLDAEHHRASLVDENVPALSKRKWVPSQVVHAKGVDGLPIEAYLTLRDSKDKQPLIVLAHGGPIGIRDERHFDPEVQFLAALGYAVLQVNFRGSEGFGRAYRQAGEGSYGTLIEDDIDSALDAALAAYPLDASRMCAMGSSYGGYSALMSAIRHPDRFRCVVSIAGPSDRILSFTASDSAYSATGRKYLEKYMGDPRAHMDSIFRISPIYRVDEIKAPVLLVHGSEDERVDYENARRLVRMLNLGGRPPALIRLEGEGHGISNAKNRGLTYPVVAAFLRQNLK